MADVFVSYTSSDREWAFWIAKELEALGHTPRVHEWEIKGGDDIYAWMEQRHDAADHVLCVMSDNYLKAPYSTLERSAALWQAASKRPGFVLLVAVNPCKLPTLADHIRRCELFGVPEEAAQMRFRDFMTKREAPQAAAFPGKVFALSNIPIRVPKHFLGREDSLAVIEKGLRLYDGRVAITALHGLRGVGKTTLAAAYAERHRGDYRATWWIRAQTDSSMRADMVALGVRLGWVATDEKEEPALDAVKERLYHEGEGVLLIYDNAVDADALSSYLPLGGRAHVLVTSNAPTWRGVAEAVEIRLWPKQIGAEYLLARTGRPSERATAETLSDMLGGLPLAHEQAAAFCERLDISLAEYQKRFAAEPQRMLDTTRDAPSVYDKRTVAKTFALAIKEAAKLDPAAEPLIVYAALMAPEPIPLFLFTEARERFDEPLASALADDGIDEAVAALRTFALIDRENISDERDPDISTGCIRLHRLVREIAASGASLEMQLTVKSKLVEVLSTVYPKGVYDDPAAWPRARRLDGLVLGLIEVAGEPPEGKEGLVADLLYEVASYSHSALGNYARAKRLFEQAVALCERHFGPEHPRTARTLNSLALHLHAEGKVADALALSKRALAIYQKVFGREHVDTAWALNTLSRFYRDAGDFAQALPLSKDALAIREKLLGPEHPHTATSLSDHARLLHYQGDLCRALALCRRTLEIDEKALGPEHPNVAWTLTSLARLHLDMSDLCAARPLCERALAIRQKRLGDNHPDTATSFSDLARLLHAEGDLPSARLHYERALTVREHTLGPNHRYTATSLSDLALLLLDQGDRTAAAKLCARALEVDEKVLGAAHPTTNHVRLNLARILLADGRPADALALSKAAFDADLDVLGERHFWTKDSARVTADALDALGRTDEAKTLRRRYGLGGA
jgi:tetratricopeptide (TPR) repeat protein